jgi:DMSO/TMAO reductase YedYZ molybdopterin-dependent catalytic subunit
VRWLLDDPDPLDGAWRLTVDGAVERPFTLDGAALAAAPTARQRAILDCTGGWWCEQDWDGVHLRDLLARAGPTSAARSVRVVSATGYDRRFALDVADGLLLATAVAGAPLTLGHGAPLRLVAPGRRGFEWVKWVERIEVLESSHRWQPPLPLQ